MLESLQTYWYLWLLLAAALVGVVFLWRMALSASKRHTRRREAELASLRHAAELKRQYEAITAEGLRDAPAETIWEGTVARIQTALERSGEIDASFARLPVCARAVYVAYYVREGAQDGLRAFFRSNGEPPTGAAPAALRELGAPKAARAAAREYAMFDESNEAISVVDAALDEQDAAFRQALESEDLVLLADRYIRAHAQELAAELLPSEYH